MHLDGYSYLIFISTPDTHAVRNSSSVQFYPNHDRQDYATLPACAPFLRALYSWSFNTKIGDIN
jgi:hypothetical protein